MKGEMDGWTASMIFNLVHDMTHIVSVDTA